MQSSLYIKDAQLFLDHCKQTQEPVSVVALKADGSILRLDGWVVISGWWRRGTHDFKNPRNGQIRKVRDVLLFYVNNHPVYL